MSLAAPLHMVWQVDGQITAAPADGSTVLVAAQDAVEARDAASGALLWRTPGAAAWCDLEQSDRATDQANQFPDQGRQVALCTLQDGIGVEALDVATGQSLVTVDEALQASSSFLVDGDVALVGVDMAGHATAARWSTATGEQAWSIVGPPVDSMSQGVSGHSDGAVITVEWSGGSMTVDAATGALLSVSDEPPADGPRVDYRVALPDGSGAVEDWDPTRTPDAARVRMVRPDGSVLVTVPGFLLRPSVDDVSVPGQVLVQDWMGSVIRAYDLSTGALVWTHDISPSLLVDGRLVGYDTAGDLLALDARTGDVLWTQTITRSTDSWGVVSDGRRMLSLEGPDLRVVTRSLATGREVWSLDQPWVGFAAGDGSGDYFYGPVMVTLMPSGLVVLAGAGRTAVLGR